MNEIHCCGKNHDRTPECHVLSISPFGDFEASRRACEPTHINLDGFYVSPKKNKNTAPRCKNSACGFTLYHTIYYFKGGMNKNAPRPQNNQIPCCCEIEIDWGVWCVPGLISSGQYTDIFFWHGHHHAYVHSSTMSRCVLWRWLGRLLGSFWFCRKRGILLRNAWACSHYYCYFHELSFACP